MNVVVDHVTKTIHGAVVLQDISLNFESGKVYGLQGENGSGKTMLLRLMCGLIYAAMQIYPALKYWNFVTTAGVVRTSSVPR